ncbi:hypothetical protein OROHE_005116 [Orobanche hederae]
MRNQHQQVCRTLTEMKEVIKKTPVATQVKLTRDLTNFSNAYQVDVEVDFTRTNERKLCGPIEDSSNYLRSLVMATLWGFHVAKKYGLGVNGLRHYSIQQIVDYSPLLKKSFSFLKTSGLVEEQFYRFRGNKGICRDPRCDENPSTQKGRSKRLQVHEPDIDQDCARAKVRDEKPTSTSLWNFD